jgi:hypothetical protein
MKQIGSFSKKLMGWGTALLALSLLAEVHAQAWRDGQAQVRAIRGTAQYTTGGGVWVPLRVGTTLKSGSTIRTAAESTVDLFLRHNGPVLRVTPSTTVALDRLALQNTGADTVIETQINLQSGRILGNVKKLAGASRYEVKTPTGVAGIRGTDYDISTDGRTTTYTSVVGTLVIAEVLPDGTIQTVIVNTGQSYTTANPVRPATPAQLADAKRQLDDIIRDTEPTSEVPPSDPITFVEPDTSPLQ